MKKLLLVLAITLSLNITNAQWVKSINTNHLVYCMATYGNIISAGTLGGGIYESTNNGQNWYLHNQGLSDLNVQTLDFLDSDHVFAGTHSGGVFYFPNTPQNPLHVWFQQNAGLTDSDVRAIAFCGQNTIAGTSSGGIFLSSNGGNNWNAVNNGIPSNTFVYSLAVMGSNVFAGTAYNGVFLSTDSGFNWTDVTNNLPTNNVWAFAVSGSNIYAATSIGVFLSSDTGTTWNNFSSGLINTEISSLAISDSVIFAGTFGNGVYASNLSSNNWINQNSLGINTDTIISLVISSTQIFAGTYSGTIWSLPLSNLPQAVNEHTNDNLLSIYPNPSKDLLVISYPSLVNRDATISIMDITGKIIYRTTASATQKTEVNTSEFAEGVYLVQLQTADFTETRKVIVAK